MPVASEDCRDFLKPGTACLDRRRRTNLLPAEHVGQCKGVDRRLAQIMVVATTKVHLAAQQVLKTWVSVQRLEVRVHVNIG